MILPRLFSVELTFLGNKYKASNEPASKPLVKLKYMGKAYQTSLTEVVTNKVVLTYRGIRYSR